MTEIERDDWMSPGQAARRLIEMYPRYAVTKTAIIRQAHEGKYPSQRYRGRNLLVRFSDVVTYNVPASELERGTSQENAAQVK